MTDPGQPKRAWGGRVQSLLIVLCVWAFVLTISLALIAVLTRQSMTIEIRTEFQHHMTPAECRPRGTR